ncbi:META domain-containing protein [Catellatospora methionotrophica]|uniref:META domain-containing protein n=1 Tax=Catellatospora methionotrophica TaxID=121620 RepID=UPI00140A0B64|nr:META domain-containing protein [Catellatospora methionotrophica]
MRVVPLLTLLLLAACAQPQDTGAGSPPGDGAVLAGRTFLSTAVVRDGKPFALVKDTRIRLTLDDRGHVGATAGCNSMGGDADLTGGRLRMTGDVSMTDMGCDPARHAQDELVSGFLQAGPTWELTGDVLKLRTDTMEVTLQDQESADPDRPLTGNRWQVDTVLDGQSAGSVPNGATAYLEFADGKVQGHTGCNTMGGSAVLGEKTITFGDLFTTKMACADDVDKLERAVLATLKGEVTWQVTADRLTLTGPDGKGLQLRAAVRWRAVRRIGDFAQVRNPSL